MKGKPGNPGLQGKLLDGSIDAFVLALETINRLSTKYRISASTYLVCNAWELMLKAKLIQDSGNRSTIFYPRKRGQPVRSLSLRDCLKRLFPNESDPIRRNIERIEQLRDEATHLVISEVPREIIALFQASAVNYHQHLYRWWGLSLSDRVPAGMMSIVYDFSPEEFDLSSRVLRRRLGGETAHYLANFQAEVRREFVELGSSPEYSVGIGYKLALTKNPNHGDIILTHGLGGATLGVVEVARDSSKTHPFRQTEAIQELNMALEGQCKVTTYDFQCVIKVHHIRTKDEFHYQSSVKSAPTQYSQALLDWITKQYSKDPLFFERAKDKVCAARKLDANTAA